MLTTNDKNNFKIDNDLLIDAINNLLTKKRTQSEEKELFFLSLFIEEIEIPSSFSSLKDNFRLVYKNDFNVLYDQYFDYLQDIFAFYDMYGDLEEQVRSYECIVKSYEEVFSSVHDFYYSLDKNWFKIFNELYKLRHQTISLSNSRSFSVLFPESSLWIANIETKQTIEDYVNTVHEYAHGISDILDNRVRTYSPQNIFIELFPMVCQIIYLQNNADIRNQIEVNKYLTNLQSIQLSEMEEIKVRFNLITSFPNVTSSRNLSRLIKKNLGEVISKEYLNQMFSSSVAENICYTYPYIIALELASLYKTDLDLFKYKMNYILSSKEPPLEIVKKLNINQK